jgi:hypothetical protein
MSSLARMWVAGRGEELAPEWQVVEGPQIGGLLTARQLRSMPMRSSWSIGSTTAVATTSPISVSKRHRHFG